MRPGRVMPEPVDELTLTLSLANPEAILFMYSQKRVGGEFGANKVIAGPTRFRLCVSHYEALTSRLRRQYPFHVATHHHLPLWQYLQNLDMAHWREFPTRAVLLPTPRQRNLCAVCSGKHYPLQMRFGPLLPNMLDAAASHVEVPPPCSP